MSRSSDTDIQTDMHICKYGYICTDINVIQTDMSKHSAHMHRYEHDSEIGDGAWRWCTVTRRLEMVHGDSEIGHC